MSDSVRDCPQQRLRTCGGRVHLACEPPAVDGRILGLASAALVFLAHEPGKFVERQDFGEGQVLEILKFDS